jgi:hypothetical protein
MRIIFLLLVISLISISCKEENVIKSKRLLVKDIIDVTNNSKLIFNYNPDSTVSKIIKTNLLSISTLDITYEGKRVDKIVTTLKNVDNPIPQFLVIESNETIYYSYDSKNMLTNLQIRDNDSGELLTSIEYGYDSNNSINKIKYLNNEQGTSEIINVEFVNQNLTKFNDSPILYDNGKNPIYEMGLQLKWGGEFEFGNYFSKNNVVKNNNWDYAIDYNDYNYPTRIKSISDKIVWSDWIFNYY